MCEIKQLTVRDFVNHTDGKVHMSIIDDDYKLLYDGRQEYLAHPEDDELDKLCDKIVESFDLGTYKGDTCETRFPEIILYLEEEK